MTVPAAARLWIRDPIAVLAEGAERGVVVEGGLIVALVGRDDPDPAHDRVFDAGRHVVLPGLVNTHHHFFQTLTRAHPEAINKELFPWLKALYPRWGRFLDRDRFRLAVRVALTELLMSGCTTASDHLFVFPADMPDAVDIEAEEAGRLGMRIALTRGVINMGTRSGGIADERLMQDDDTVLADCERVIGRWHDRRPGAMTTVALAPCAPFNVTTRMMCEAASLAETHDCRLHTHLGETHDEDAFCLARFGKRPLDYLEDCGWLNERVWLAHGIHFDDGEVARLGRHRVGVCHCPTSNAVLASGLCRTRELEAAGSPVGLGVDGSASNDSSNMMETVRHALMLGRLRYDAASVTHFDALRWASEGSAACLGRTDIGRIAPGMAADLSLFTLDDLRFSGAGDPIAALVLCGAHRADRVMVAGDWRVEDGAPVGVDVARLRHDHGEAAKAFLAAL
ncbi:8-oxoguanine deaminase [Oharaeibacter diazotrophicus]|uniref:8-oxoguanine deaminase n=1 Tax=Oharaeibacter diazotrophicus TaxID=1920512 RepID=A0A4R6RJA3_9HYPH|nr:8-oxoguanine deaminase [Oharaeibacter diazotrophicus]TDP86540.1 8-oxoguanine deaminase [Oharaeibacter diazotrophicus]BBE71518.1 8-oxoguanine deaminase [Pleomorphomonas sp. SM30]GLS78279.1 8-oxoguanine deaminase [Oharaeibacter diazotrophicus]